MKHDSDSPAPHHSSSDADPMHGRFVPLDDRPAGHPVFVGSFVTFALIGAALGGLLFGWLAYAITSGSLPIAGLGQFAAAGWGVATFTGAGLGVALGGLAGGMVALFRVPRAHGRDDHRHSHRHA